MSGTGREFTLSSDDEVLTPKEVCGILKCGRTKLWQLEKAGEIPFFKVGRASRTTRSKLADYIERQFVCR